MEGLMGFAFLLACIGALLLVKPYNDWRKSELSHKDQEKKAREDAQVISAKLGQPYAPSSGSAHRCRFLPWPLSLGGTLVTFGYATGVNNGPHHLWIREVKISLSFFVSLPLESGSMTKCIENFAIPVSFVRIYGTNGERIEVHDVKNETFEVYWTLKDAIAEVNRIADALYPLPSLVEGGKKVVNLHERGKPS